MNLDYLATFLNTISGLVSVETLIGVVAIALFYWNRFNSWTDKEAKYGKARPPRQFTTWARFMTYAVLYTLSMEFVYLLLLSSPNLIDVILKVAGNPPGAPSINKSDSNFSLWVMVFLLGFFPHLPVLRQIEENYRHWFHQRAFIPAEAKALIHHLLANPAFFNPDDEAAQEVIRSYGQGMPAGWGSGRADNRLSSKWFRLVYLRERFEQWRSQPQIERYIGHCEEEYKLFQEHFKQLHLDVITYIQRRHDDGGAHGHANLDESLQQLKINIMRQIEKLLERAYEFVACGVLSTERIHNRRIAKLNYFGLFPTYEPGVPIILDIVLKNAIVVFLVTTLTSIAYIGYRQLNGQTHLRLVAGLVWAVIALMMIGLCIFGAVAVYRGLTRKSRFDAANDGDAVLIGPFVHQCVGFLTGYLCGLLVIYPYIYIATASHQGAWASLVQSLPWPLTPAVTAGFVVYYLAVLSAERSRIKDALVQGLGTGAAGLISCLWAFGDLTDKLPSFVYIVTTCTGIGGAIGCFFPWAYRRRVAAIYQGAERRHSPRISLVAPSELRSAAEAIGCQAVNLSTSGARLNAACHAEVGEQVELELPGVGSLDSMVVRKGDQETVVRFQFDQDRELALRHYIGNLGLAAA
jgi:PilZ domain